MLAEDNLDAAADEALEAEDILSFQNEDSPAVIKATQVKEVSE